MGLLHIFISLNTTGGAGCFLFIIQPFHQWLQLYS
jgi:hypothetical protein